LDLSLASVTFTINNDIAPAAATTARLVLYSGSVDTLAGNDGLVGTGVTSDGIYINGILDTSLGNDKITGSTTAGYSAGISISTYGEIKSGLGNDTIEGTGAYGINIFGKLESGDGNDLINGTATGDFYGVYNDGTLNTGEGDDEIHGLSQSYGIFNAKTKTINMSKADLKLPKIQKIPKDPKDPTDDDLLTGAGAIGINNAGSIQTGVGKDTIIGISTGGGYYGNGKGIQNTGTIDTGDGNDTVDALIGGFSGDGTTKLGAGDDILKGFGVGKFDGGTGKKDKALFNAGVYKIKKIVATEFQVSSGISSGSGGTFTLTDFEQVGGALLPNATIGIKEGLLIVNRLGNVSFL
jgi:hypothetical protein